MEEVKDKSKQAEIKCSCGASLEYDPTTEKLKCNFCGTVKDIEISGESIAEINYYQYILTKGSTAPDFMELKLMLPIFGLGLLFF